MYRVQINGVLKKKKIKKKNKKKDFPISKRWCIRLESPGLWTLSIIRNSKIARIDVSETGCVSIFSPSEAGS
jgi:hypothetical protein